MTDPCPTLAERYGESMLLRILLALLVVWVVVTLLGAFIKAVFWLAIVGGLLFLATAAVGYLKRDTLPR